MGVRIVPFLAPGGHEVPHQSSSAPGLLFGIYSSGGLFWIRSWVSDALNLLTLLSLLPTTPHLGWMKLNYKEKEANVKKNTKTNTKAKLRPAFSSIRMAVDQKREKKKTLSKSTFLLRFQVSRRLLSCMWIAVWVYDQWCDDGSVLAVFCRQCELQMWVLGLTAPSGSIISGKLRWDVLQMIWWFFSSLSWRVLHVRHE